MCADKAYLARIHRCGCERQALVFPKALAETEDHLDRLPHYKLACGSSMIGHCRVKLYCAAHIPGFLQDAQWKCDHRTTRREAAVTQQIARVRVNRNMA